MLVCVFSDEKENDFQPAGVEELLLVSSVEVNHPSSSVLVARILPVREDALLEDGVVSTHGKSARHLDVVVQTPEVLHSGHRDDGSLVLFPGARLVILEEPQGPCVLKT